MSIRIIPSVHSVLIVAINLIDVNINITNKTASLRVQLIDEHGTIAMQFLDMDSDAYSAWGTDDSYVINWVLAKLELVLPIAPVPDIVQTETTAV